MPLTNTSRRSEAHREIEDRRGTDEGPCIATRAHWVIARTLHVTNATTHATNPASRTEPYRSGASGAKSRRPNPIAARKKTSAAPNIRNLPAFQKSRPGKVKGLFAKNPTTSVNLA